MGDIFHRADGTPRDCKFCHAHVGYDPIKGRVVNLDGTLHSDSCARRKAFYKNEAAIRVHGARDERKAPRG